MLRDRDTICAVSTPPGYGGIAVVRVSGSRAVEVTRGLAKFLPTQTESHHIYFGNLTANDSRAIDEVLVSVFHHGRSFTGEETTEISCHGSPAITQWVLQELIRAGCRAADRGEFSYRAFMNGKIDLVQAEGILQLVESQSKLSAQQGLRQLQGGLSKPLLKIESDLMWVMAHIEASIDFSTENLDVVDQKEMIARTEEIERALRSMLATYDLGRLLVDGLRIALSGLPNVGKSSLFNSILGEDRAIVTEVPGTTRDLVESAFLLEGIKVNVVDTAGIREAKDQVEKIGIEKTRKSQASADLNLFVFDVNQGLGAQDLEILRGLLPKNLYLIGNKIDLYPGSPEVLKGPMRASLEQGKIFKNSDEIDAFLKDKVFFISTFKDTCREIALGLVREFVRTSEFEDRAVISQSRHFENLQRALGSLLLAKKSLQETTESEFAAMDLKAALMAVQETLGKRFDDQIMDQVFRQFCIGK